MHLGIGASTGSCARTIAPWQWPQDISRAASHAHRAEPGCGATARMSRARRVSPPPQQGQCFCSSGRSICSMTRNRLFSTGPRPGARQAVHPNSISSPQERKHVGNRARPLLAPPRRRCHQDFASAPRVRSCRACQRGPEPPQPAHCERITDLSGRAPPSTPDDRTDPAALRSRAATLPHPRRARGSDVRGQPHATATANP